MKHLFLLLIANFCLNASAEVLDVDRTTLLNMCEPSPLAMLGNTFSDQMQVSNGGSSNNATVPQTVTPSYDLPYLKQFLTLQGTSSLNPAALMKDKIIFCNLFTWTIGYNDQINMTHYTDYGGMTTHMRESSDESKLYCDDFFYDGLSQPLYVDKSNNSVCLPTFVLSGNTRKSETYGVWTDVTYTKYYLINEDYLTHNAAPADIHGILHSDGTIVFDNGFFFYLEAYTQHYNAKNVLTSTDTTYYMSRIIRDLCLVAPNAKHEFRTTEIVYEDITNVYYDDISHSIDAYMYQTDDTTLVVMNLWGLGGQGSVMYLREDGSMCFPFQRILRYDMSSYNFDNYWFYPDFYNFYGSESVHAIDSHGTYTDGVISWGTNKIADYGINGYVMLNATPSNAWAAYYFDVFGYNQLYYTNTEQTSELLSGDVDGDGKADINDVTALIDLLLGGGAIPDNADVDGDGINDINDITALIDLMLNGGL